jgi:hypothetical protein
MRSGGSAQGAVLMTMIGLAGLAVPQPARSLASVAR